MKYNIGIIPTTKPTPAEMKFMSERREGIIHKMVLDYFDEHPGLAEEQTLWTAFKGKKPVRHVLTGKTHYIHSVQSWVEWETNKIQTRYLCRENREQMTMFEHENAVAGIWGEAVTFSPEELEVVK
jgi:hypothetical protein